jgi:hypothetical protein
MSRRSLATPTVPLKLLVEFSAKYRGEPVDGPALVRLERMLALARQNESAARSVAEHWTAADPVSFFRAVVHALRSSREDGDREHLRSMVTADLLVAALLEPDCFSDSDAVELIRELKARMPNLDLQVAWRAFGDDGDGPRPVSAATAQRAMALLGALSPGERVLPFLSRACRLGDERVSSQVARLAGRYRAQGLLVRLLEDANPRVRANAVESLAGAQHVSDCRELLWRAAGDEHHRVAVNALVALARLGEPEALERLEALARHPAPEFRAAAAWGMGELGDLRFQPTLTRLYHNDAGAVRRNALRSLVRLRRAQPAELLTQSVPETAEPWD